MPRLYSKKYKLQSKPTANLHQNSARKNIIGSALTIIGAVPFGYTAFFNFNISIWIACCGFIVILFGIFLILHGYINSWILYTTASILILISLIISYSLQRSEPLKPNILKDAAVIKNDIDSQSLVKKEVKPSGKDEIIKEETKLSNRAWVNWKQFYFSDVDSGKMPVFHFSLVAFGLPANILDIADFIKIGKGLYLGDLETFPLNTHGSITCLSPNQETSIQNRSFRKLEGDDILALKVKEKRLIASVRIIYFTKTPSEPDTTIFSAEYDWDTGNTYLFGNEHFNFMH